MGANGPATPHMSASGPVRMGADPVTTALQLGPLAHLAGTGCARHGASLNVHLRARGFTFTID